MTAAVVIPSFEPTCYQQIWVVSVNENNFRMFFWPYIEKRSKDWRCNVFFATDKTDVKMRNHQNLDLKKRIHFNPLSWSISRMFKRYITLVIVLMFIKLIKTLCASSLWIHKAMIDKTAVDNPLGQYNISNFSKMI